ncbi:suppressor protein SRP40 [Lactuca sativa]|uniref:LisH domain-containing protein n=1 Tax=Lactuca sativa TaxID=4236 RepID=A0A9R1UYU4_LACSA|nr:suppressor protein SRP40 [Lactuca sativa]KAJ0196807.1 hypothetical protein LSAT_V11C700364460 [Lactuca sativa]
MLHLDTKNPSNSHTTASSISLLAFKPRQVLLAQHSSRSTMAASALKEENSSNITSLTPELKGALHQSILDYFHRNGFSKTLKRFQSEAPIQTDTQKASLLHLEDIFCNYNTCNADSNKNNSNTPVLGNDEAIKKDNFCITNEEITTKKKKKKGVIESENGAIKDQQEVTDKKIFEFGKNCGQDIIVNERETKPKKKKKIKHDSNSSIQAEEATSIVVKTPVNDTINGLKIEDSTKKVADKEKKKKNKKLSNDSGDTEKEGIEPYETKKEEKSSKKRKRSDSDENEIVTEESKCQKTETLKEKKSKKEENNGQETSNKQTNGQLEMNGEKSGAHKSTKKQQNVTTEPKTVNAFQRVKIDQVEFAHEKLQDNSYWAKDGAEIGYGAKAQEVLGQVRGRDFRHEKTKKKRGSYRGGLIDLQSHSIKFNYSDEE